MIVADLSSDTAGAPGHCSVSKSLTTHPPVAARSLVDGRSLTTFGLLCAGTSLPTVCFAASMLPAACQLGVASSRC
jgi:hypothetical protein